MKGECKDCGLFFSKFDPTEESLCYIRMNKWEEAGEIDSFDCFVPSDCLAVEEEMELT